ncbi:hypothetical protein F2Q69_00003613 [Brassica cretica]|uniref:Uncharacterized protein n=2 Tax=Brassica TaxID=3705 RepID=A0A8S9PGF3_BRACR|nr:hypothetical protein F2Q69_00003613 [Brassica cretica]
MSWRQRNMKVLAQHEVRLILVGFCQRRPGILKSHCFGLVTGDKCHDIADHQRIETLLRTAEEWLGRLQDEMNLLVLAGGVLNFDSGVAYVPPMVVRPLPSVFSLSVGDEHPASDSASHLSIVSPRAVSRFVVVYGGLSLDEITISFD